MTKPEHVYATYSKTTPERLWQALTDGTMTKNYHQVVGGWALIAAGLKSLLETGEALTISQPQQAPA